MNGYLRKIPLYADGGIFFEKPPSLPPERIFNILNGAIENEQF